MGNELTVTHSNIPAISVSPEEWIDRRKRFNELVNHQLREGIDYGKIPGTDKPTLWKPGAEKIAQFFGCASIPKVVSRDHDIESGYLNVVVEMSLVNIQSGNAVAVGVGSCSSFESKYRWRWEYWNRNGTPPAEEGWEEGYNKFKRQKYYRRRIANRDLIDQWNTVLKMAKKRAFVDAVLTISAASEKFTQDVEDFVDGDYEVVDTQSKGGSKAKRATPPETPPPTEAEEPTTKKTTEKERGRWAKLSDEDFQVPDWFDPNDTQMITTAMSYNITFGKHKGKTLGEVYQDEPSYIAFLTTQYEAKTKDQEKFQNAAKFLRAYKRWEEDNMKQDQAIPEDLRMPPEMGA